jgi:ATP synthase protein I
MIPTMMGACVLVGCFMGFKLDQFFGTKPWLSLLFLVFGIVAGIRETALIIRRINEEQK